MKKKKQIPLDKSETICFAAEAGICKGCVEQFSKRDVSSAERKTDEEILSEAAKAAHRKNAAKKPAKKSAKTPAGKKKR